MPALQSHYIDSRTKIIMSSHIKALLRNRYPIEEWALAFEVAPETGGGTRRADAVAMNMWRSRGHAIHGFEFKVSRSDWLRELKEPSKADAVAQYCDYWWLVIDGDHIVKDGELPEGWGLLTVTRDKNDKSPKGLRVQAKAAKQNAAPLSKLFGYPSFMIDLPISCKIAINS